jgi:hypothetical protein
VKLTKRQKSKYIATQYTGQVVPEVY